VVAAHSVVGGLRGMMSVFCEWVGGWCGIFGVLGLGVFEEGVLNGPLVVGGRWYESG